MLGQSCVAYADLDALEEEPEFLQEDLEEEVQRRFHRTRLERHFRFLAQLLQTRVPRLALSSVLFSVGRISSLCPTTCLALKNSPSSKRTSLETLNSLVPG